MHASQISEKQIKALARTCSGLSTAAIEEAKKQLGDAEYHLPGEGGVLFAGKKRQRTRRSF